MRDEGLVKISSCLMTMLIVTMMLVCSISFVSGDESNVPIPRYGIEPMGLSVVYEASSFNVCSNRPGREYLPKLESHLAGIADAYKRGEHDKIIQIIENSDNINIVGNKLRVKLVLDDVIYIDELSSYDNVEVECMYENMIQALVPLERLEELASASFIHHVTLPFMPQSCITSEGVETIDATVLHDLGIRGAGATVAVIDSGFLDYMINPEIPSANIIKFKNFGSMSTYGTHDHGTAMVEVLLDVAPDARLYLLRFDFDTEFANAVSYAISKGVDVVSHSMGWFNVGGYDGSGPICKLVDEARAAGILWVNSMGNHRWKHYSSIFTDTDPIADIAGHGSLVHEDLVTGGITPFGSFSGVFGWLDSTECIPINCFSPPDHVSIWYDIPPPSVNPNAWIDIFLSWNDWGPNSPGYYKPQPWATGVEDYDLEVWCIVMDFVNGPKFGYPPGEPMPWIVNGPVFVSDDLQPPNLPREGFVEQGLDFSFWDPDGGGPADVLGPYGSWFALYMAVIPQISGTFPGSLKMYSSCEFLHCARFQNSLLVPADAAGVLAAGATDYSTDVIRDRSSWGKTFDGRITHVCAPTAVSNWQRGIATGTSTAAAHLAGAAALLKSAFPTITPNEIEIALETTAVDLGAPGVDDTYGHGRINVFHAYLSLLGSSGAIIDIKPGSYPNSINPYSKGKVPVAILTSDDVDASTVNPDTVDFLDAMPVKSTIEDVDKDGDSDMILHFRTQELDFSLLVDEGDDYPYAYLSGETTGGTAIMGKDTVRLVGPLFEILEQIIARFPILEQLLQPFLNILAGL